MDDSTSIFSKINCFNENLIANIQGGVIICQFDPIAGTSKVLYLSEGWTELTGYTLQELNESFDGIPQALVYPEDRVRCNREYGEQTSKGHSYQLEYRVRRKDNSLIWVIDKGLITASAEGYNQNQSIITNITPIKENEEKLRMSEARFRIAIKASRAAVFEYDIVEKRYLYLENAAVIFHVDAQTVLSSFDAARSHMPNFTIVDVFQLWFHPEDVPILQHSYAEVLGGAIGACDARVRQPDGSYLWCTLHHAPVADEVGQPVRVIGHLVNIDDQHRQTERLLMEAQSDALTGLYNKTALREFAQQLLTATPQQSHALLILDIDNFKGVNDQLGHLFGDAVLMDVSAKLNRLFRLDSLVGRIGGDEFVVLLPSVHTAAEAAKRAETICGAFRHTYSGEKSNYKISCSVGIALSAAEDRFDTLLHKADLALYRAKALGKDQYVVYTSQLGTTISNGTFRVNQTDNADSGKLKIKERIFELLYDSVDFSGSVNMILSLLGQLLDASRITIFENTPDNRFAQCIYEWCVEGAVFDTPAEQRLPVDELSYYANFDGDGIFCCRDFSTLPQPLRAAYEHSDTRFTFQVAIVGGSRIRGFMRYDSASDADGPTPEQIEIMTFAAKITGTFIIKKRADESAQLYNQNKMEALDNVPTAIYVIDEQYRLQYVNNMTLSVYPNVKLGETCHEVFMLHNTPCSDCPALHCQTGSCSKEIYNPYSKMWMISSASTIRWSGRDHMRLLCCQVITQYKNKG